ncbi:hypothetical protein CIK75_02210 [Glutamicibacter sp. BW78]|uniref:recombinase family protein n=1 Tax=Glutamicibacter sp. BW78 TaxID=2024403 RepID=UPI000BB742D8|nr:recombinase family protein [Glutamicibacter sp. BW78]PCC26654.1 hypothetical protein CIK75_02210 [Glutamicibacter sp. BW78]
MQNQDQRPSKQTVAREYLRVSRDRHGTGKSPDQQHNENMSAVAKRGWKLHPQPYRDDDRSASKYATRAREDFRRLADDLEDGRFDADVLVLWESSRGSRRTGEWVNLIELCEERGVRVLVTTHGREYDPANARDRRSMLEDAVDSEYESAKSSERIRRDVRAAAEQGRVHGKNLYGYRRVYDEKSRLLKHIEEEPDQAKIVKEAARRVLAGESLYAIAKSFNKLHVPPRRPSFKEHRAHLGWTPPAVKSMLLTAAYAGKRQHRGEIVADGAWPALIDPEKWEQKLVPLLNNPARKKTNDWPAKHLLSGIAVCGICGSGTRAGKQNLGKKKYGEDGGQLPREHYHTYLCHGVPGKSGFHVAMKEEHLDVVVTELMLARLERPDFLALLGQQDHGVDDERQALIDRIEKDRKYLEEVGVKAAQRNRPEILFDQEDLVRPRIEEAQKRLERLTATDPLVLDLAASGDVRSAWNTLELVSKRRVIRALMSPRISPVGKGSKGQTGINYDRVDPGWH